MFLNNISVILNVKKNNTFSFQNYLKREISENLLLLRIDN